MQLMMIKIFFSYWYWIILSSIIYGNCCRYINITKIHFYNLVRIIWDSYRVILVC